MEGKRPEPGGNGRQGLALVFQLGLKRVDDQMRTIESLDLKVSIILAFIGVMLGIIAGFASASDKFGMVLIRPVSWIFSLGILLIFVAVFFAFLAFWVRDYRWAYALEELAKWPEKSPMKLGMHLWAVCWKQLAIIPAG